MAYLGGAIATDGAGARLALRGGRFEGNHAESHGGAVFVDGGSVEISGGAFVENRARENGGAVYGLRGRLRLDNSTLHGNEAELGGGVYVHGAEATLTHLTLMENRARRIKGAGLYGAGGELRLRNSIVAGSGAGDDCSGSLAQKRGNFSQDGSCSTWKGGDPLFAERVDEPAHYPLLDASPAHGAGDPAFCLPTDQLGQPRPHCDIGAIESTRDPGWQSATAVGIPQDCGLADQIIAANSDAAAGRCPAGDGADRIVIRRDIRLSEALPPIDGDLTIEGNGHTIDGAGRFRIFEVAGGTVVIKNLTLINGSAADYGGALLTRGYADVTNSRLVYRGNRARFGGAIGQLENSILRVFDSGFYDNAAAVRGGAIFQDGRCVRLDGNVFRRNTAPYPRWEWQGKVHLDGGAVSCGGREFNQFLDS